MDYILMEHAMDEEEFNEPLGSNHHDDYNACDGMMIPLHPYPRPPGEKTWADPGYQGTVGLDDQSG